MSNSPTLHSYDVGTPEVKSYAQIPSVLSVPNLIHNQLQSYEWFKSEGLKDVYQEVSPISDYTISLG